MTHSAEFFNLAELFDLAPHEAVAIIGSGGKTTLLWYLAGQYRSEKVLVTPTTKIFLPLQHTTANRNHDSHPLPPNTEHCPVGQTTAEESKIQRDTINRESWQSRQNGQSWENGQDRQWRENGQTEDNGQPPHKRLCHDRLHYDRQHYDQFSHDQPCYDQSCYDRFYGVEPFAHLTSAEFGITLAGDYDFSTNQETLENKHTAHDSPLASAQENLSSHTGILDNTSPNDEITITEHNSRQNAGQNSRQNPLQENQCPKNTPTHSQTTSCRTVPPVIRSSPAIHTSKEVSPSQTPSETPVPTTFLPDTHLPDTPLPDAPFQDASLPDSFLPDTPLPDSFLPDCSLPDAPLAQINGSTSSQNKQPKRRRAVPNPERFTHKIQALPSAILASQEQLFDKVFMECDGARNLPLKGWASHEPVIPPFTTMTIAVIPLWAVGVKAGDHCIHRAELFYAMARCQAGDSITLTHLTRVIGHSRGLLANTRGKTVLLLHLHTMEQLPLAKKLVRSLPKETLNLCNRIVAGSAREGWGKRLYKAP